MKISKLIIINFIILVALLEIPLRFYNPFGFRLKGDNIILENNTIRHFIVNNDKIIHSKNSLGLRGPELINNDNLKIITVGGSTTENFYHDDKKTWSYLLYKRLAKIINTDLWLNNAGLDGHSTYGHIRLIEDYLYKLKPDIIIFLIGTNDVNLDKENTYDINYDFSFSNILKTENQRYFIKNLGSYFATKSEFFSLLLNFYRYYYKTNNNHIYSNGNVTNNPYNYLEHDREIFLLKDFVTEQNNIKKKLLNQYEERIKKIISLSKLHNFTPIFLTQPTIYGSKSYINLTNDNINYADRFFLNLELYNNLLRELTFLHKIHLIDIAKKIPKNPYFFSDKIHFTEKGLEYVAKLVANDFFKNCHIIIDKELCNN